MEYAAHIRALDGRVQTVYEHCREAAELAAKFAEVFGAADMGYLAGLFHDLGKLLFKFDDYIHNPEKYRRGEIDHAFAGAKYLMELTEALGEKGCYYPSVLVAHTIVSHHGLHNWLDDNGEDYFQTRISKGDGYEEIRKNADEMLSFENVEELIYKASAEYEKLRQKILSISTNDVLLSFYLGMFERLMQSVLIDADRTNTADFMLGKEASGESDAQSVWESMSQRMNETLEKFSKRTDFISQKRRSISQRCADFAKHKVGACRLIVPTGGGKTLSSLRFAIEYSKEFHKERIFYIAPFMSILEQNSDVIKGIAGEENVLEHHSNMLQEIESEEELNVYELHSEKWDTPVIATTMVQFFNALFSGKMASVRRFHKLSNSVIIIDEVQSVPIKCVHMFNLAVNFLTEICGSTVVLSSATQPAFEETEYKLRLDKNDLMVGDYSKDFIDFKRTELIPALTVEGYTYESAAEFCTEKFKEWGNVLFVVNTKSAAMEIYKKVCELNSGLPAERQAETVHLSTNMCPAHRKETLERVRRKLEKSEPIICVTTQLIEAGVDISFRCVIRSLAGLDNAAQAAGRCNRNGEAEEVCPVYVINIRDEKLGSLKEIRDAQDVSRLILSVKRGDYLGVEIQKAYFSKLFSTPSIKNQLSYQAEKTTLLELLSTNKRKFEYLKDKKLKNRCQAFKTAGELFRIIDNDTLGVIVPYNSEAEDIISRLDSEFVSRKDFRKAQKYTVEIYSNMKEKLLKTGALRLLKSGAVTLESRFYSDEYGLSANQERAELLVF